MRKLLLSFVACLLVTSSPAFPQGITGMFPGPGTPQAPASYAGVGDVQAMVAYWGFEAYSSATKGNGQAVICTSGDATCMTINSLSDGTFDLATVTGTLGCTDNSCTVKAMCELVSNSCSLAGGTIALVQPTIADRPTLHFPCGAVAVCAHIASFPQQLFTSGDPPAVAGSAQPFSQTLTFNPGTGSDFIEFTIGNQLIGSNTAPKAVLSSNNFTNFIIGSTNLTTNSWYAAAGLLNGTSSDLWYNSTHVGTGNAGTNAPNGTQAASVIATSVAYDFAEMGYWSGSSNQTAVIANIQSRLGF